jgi:hypothetical protein
MQSNIAVRRHWALQIQRLEGSRPSGLWELYAAELVLSARSLVVEIRGASMHCAIVENSPLRMRQREDALEGEMTLRSG